MELSRARYPTWPIFRENFSSFLAWVLETAGVSEMDELQMTMFVYTASSHILWRRYTDLSWCCIRISNRRFVNEIVSPLKLSWSSEHINHTTLVDRVIQEITSLSIVEVFAALWYNTLRRNIAHFARGPAPRMLISVLAARAAATVLSTETKVYPQ